MFNIIPAKFILYITIGICAYFITRYIVQTQSISWIDVLCIGIVIASIVYLLNKQEDVPSATQASSSNIIQTSLQGESVKIQNNHLLAGIKLQGAIWNNLQLKDFFETTDKTDFVQLLGEKSHFRIIWKLKSSNQDISFPDENTTWQHRANEENQPVILFFRNNMGMAFTKSIQLERDKSIAKIHCSTNNPFETEIEIECFAVLSIDADLYKNSYINGVGLFENSIQIHNSNTSGSYDWFGLQTPYWLYAIKSSSQNVTVSYTRNDTNSEVYISLGSQKIAPNQATTWNCSLGVIAQTLPILKKYNKNFNKVDESLNLGYSKIISYPMLKCIVYIDQFLHNYVLSVISFVILLNLVMTPVAYRTYVSLQTLQNLQPELKRIEQQYKNNQNEMTAAILQLYKKHNVNPLGSVLLLIVKMLSILPMFFVLPYYLQARHEQWLWISDVSKADSTSILNLFNLLPWPGYSSVALLPLIFAVLFYIQQRIENKSAPQSVTLGMTFFILICMLKTSAIVIIYTITHNICSIIQNIAFKIYIQKSAK